MIEEMIMRLMKQLYSGVNSVSYKGIYFPVRELEYVSPMDFRSMKHICIDIPKYLGLETNGVSVTYEMTKSWAMTDAKARENACFRLATHFVKEILPKIDFKLNTIMHNEEVEKILDVLD
jgi:hypothetical protein